MNFKFLSMLAAATLMTSTAFATPQYEEKLAEYKIHLKAMEEEAATLDRLETRFDESSDACLKDLQAGNKGLVCMHMKKDKLDFEYEYKKFTTYNRIRKVSKYERALQGMMERELFSLKDKTKANELFKTHMDEKSARQVHLNKLGEKVYSAIEKFNELADDRLNEINSLKKK